MAVSEFTQVQIDELDRWERAFKLGSKLAEWEAFLHDLVAGTTEAGKAVTQDSSQKTDYMDVTTFKIGGVPVTALLGGSLTVHNATGSPMTAGQLVYLSGWNTPDDVPEVILADADDPAKPAALVLTEDIADGSTGNAQGVYQATGLDTSLLAVDTILYLSATAGDYTNTAPTGAGQVVQRVGIVAVSHAVTGEILFFPGWSEVSKLPASVIQLLTATALEINGAADEQTHTAGAGGVTAKRFVETDLTAADPNEAEPLGVALSSIGAGSAAVIQKNGTHAITADAPLVANDDVKVGTGARATKWNGSQVNIQAAITGELTAFTQPVGATAVEILQAADVEADRGHVIRVVGSDAGGNAISEDIALDAANTTTPVAGATPFTTISGLYTADGVALGAQNVTLQASGGGAGIATLAGATSELGADVPSGTREAYCNKLTVSGPNADATFITIVGVSAATDAAAMERVQLNAGIPAKVTTTTVWRYIDRICLGEFTNAASGAVKTDEAVDPLSRRVGRVVGAAAARGDDALVVLNLLPLSGFTNPLSDITSAALAGKSAVWVDGARADTYTEDGSFLRPYKTLAAGLAAISAARPTVILMPDTYTLTAAAAVPTITGSYCRILGLGEVNIIGAAGGLAALSWNPGAGTHVLILERLNITAGAAGVGVQVENTAADGIHRLEVRASNFLGTEKAIDVNHTVAGQAIRVDLYECYLEGSVDAVIANAGDWVRLYRCESTASEAVETDAGAVAAEVGLFDSEFFHEHAVSGGNAAQVVNAVGCRTRTGDVVAALDTNDLIGLHTETISPAHTLADAARDVTASAAELNALNGAPLDATLAVGVEGADTINVGIQLKDADGADLAVRGRVRAYLSDDANGDSLVVTAPSGGVAIGTDGLAIPQTPSLQSGLLVDGNLAIDAVAEKFKTTQTACYFINGVSRVKAPETAIVFSAAHVITALKFGVVLIQIDAAGTISTKVPGSPQAYDNAGAALAALPVVDAGRQSLGYIAIENNAGDWTANTDDLTNASDVTTAAFNDTAETTVNGAKAWDLVSEVDGDIDLDIVEAGAKTCYLILALTNGKLVASGAITFAP